MVKIESVLTSVVSGCDFWVFEVSLEVVESAVEVSPKAVFPEMAYG